MGSLLWHWIACHRDCLFYMVCASLVKNARPTLTRQIANWISFSLYDGEDSFFCSETVSGTKHASSSIFLLSQSQPPSGMTASNLNSWNSSLTYCSSTEVVDDWPAEPPQQESHHSSFSIFPHGHFVYKQLRSQFSHDIWWLSLAILFITITESDHSKAEPLVFSTFKIIFEAVSAYSCVGVSFGYPGQSYSFCGAWHTLSKLLLIAVSLRGRHRGLSVIITNVDIFLEPRVIGEENTRLEKNTEGTLVGCVWDTPNRSSFLATCTDGLGKKRPSTHEPILRAIGPKRLLKTLLWLLDPSWDSGTSGTSLCSFFFP